MLSLFFLDVPERPGYTIPDLFMEVFPMQPRLDSLASLPELLSVFHIHTPLFVGRKREELLPLAALWPGFHGYHPNPDLSDCNAGMELFRASGCDGIVAVGGGSCIDTAKAIKASLLSDAPDLLSRGILEPNPEQTIPLIAVPTTAGTGSEATQTAVVYVNNRKVSLSHPLLRPDAVILDSQLLRDLPLLHKKCCALDALCQGIESYWSRSATEESRRHASIAILSVLEQFPAYLDGDKDAARYMLRAAYESGLAIQITRTTAAHAMSYILTKTYDLPHGYACAVTLPVLWDRLNQDPELSPVMQSLQALLGLRSLSDGPLLFRGLMSWLSLPGLPVPDGNEIRKLVSEVNAERLGNHPQKLTESDLEQVYRKALMPMNVQEQAEAISVWRDYAGLY